VVRLGIGVIVALFMDPAAVDAGIFLNVLGETTIIAESAPVRTGYPAGRIIAVLHKGEGITILKAWKNGDGLWIEIKLKVGNRDQLGYVAKEQTNFDVDIIDKK
jgi:hypothetical protein